VVSPHTGRQYKISIIGENKDVFFLAKLEDTLSFLSGHLGGEA
jgi:hypothetical protein